MASEVGICNSALVKIGEPTITALDQGGKAASTCNELYEKLRDELLRRHQWNFAVARAKLARLSETPAFGFDPFGGGGLGNAAGQGQSGNIRQDKADRRATMAAQKRYKHLFHEMLLT